MKDIVDLGTLSLFSWTKSWKESMQLEPGYTIGQYTIEKILGEGGMATIYQAKHNLLTSSFALKILKTKNETARQRLLQEGRVQAIIDHPNIVSVIDIIEIEHHPCLVMEFIQGSSLTEWMNEEKPTLFQIEDVFMQVLDGVEAAHNLNIVHRDLKPANIMIKKINLYRVVAKIFDFGVAKNIDGPTMTRTGVTMGTPSYMSPEQIRSSKSIDQRADIFSLGAMLYRLVTKQRPFSGRNNLELFNSIASIPHPNPKDFNPNIPDRIVRAIDGALIKNPQFRFPDCATFRMVLQGKRVWDSNTSASTTNQPTKQEPQTSAKITPITPLSLPPLSQSSPRIAPQSTDQTELFAKPNNQADNSDPTVSWVSHHSLSPGRLEPLPKQLVDDDGPTEYIEEANISSDQISSPAPTPESTPSADFEPTVAGASPPLLLIGTVLLVIFIVAIICSVVIFYF